MKCMKCGAETMQDTTTDVFDVGDSVIVIRNIPCRKCTECAEVIYSGKVIRELEKIVDRAKQTLSEVAVIDFTKVAA